MEQRRICVFGAGAVGGHLAARFAAAGHDVSAVARGPNLAALKAGGIALREGERSYAGRVRASDNAADLGAQDVVFVTTKATALSSLANAVPSLSHADTVFVFVQNGIPWWYAQGLSGARPRPPDLSPLDPGGRLARAVAPARVIGAVVYSSNNLDAPGLVTNHSIGRNMLVVGEPDDRQTPRIAALRALLGATGLHSPEATDLRQSVWDKLLLNFGSTLCVPLGEPISALTEDPALHAALEQLAAVTARLARAKGLYSPS